MTLNQIQARKDAIEKIAGRHGACNIRIFGSVARGDSGPVSDLDLLVSVGQSTSAWFPAGLIVELEALLGCRVEIVTDNGLNPLIKETVLREAVAL